jgi:hypothetical protein
MATGVLWRALVLTMAYSISDKKVNTRHIDIHTSIAVEITANGSLSTP